MGVTRALALVHLIWLGCFIGEVRAAEASSATLMDAGLRSGVYLSVAKVVDLNLYDAGMIDVGHTRFFVFARKKGGLSGVKMERAIKKFWPKLQNRLRAEIAEAAVVDFDAPLGGGPLGKFVVGIYTSTAISKDHGELIQAATGWEPLQSSLQYIRKYYGSFSDPEQAYIDDMVVHELGHLFFGFGRTQAPRHRPQEFWFSFGLGLVYDRMVWDSLGSKRSPLFEAVISRWKTQFSGNMGVDQRLVNPDISKDAAWGLSRLQTYGHGKAFVYLTELRHRIGVASFDKIVREYLRRPVGSEISYDDFLSFCPQKYRATIVKVEQEFSVR